MFDPKIKVYKPAKENHDLSFSSLISTNFGRAKLVLNKHLFAGETAYLSKEHLLKLEAMLAPAFQKYDIRFDSFIIPEDVHWKDSIKYYPQISSVFSHQPSPVPNCSINPVQLYLMVAMDQVYNVGINDDVLNIWSGTLIDDMNLPTFDDFLDEVRSLPDSKLLAILNNDIVSLWPSPTYNFAVTDFDMSFDEILSSGGAPGVFKAGVLASLPFFISREHKLRNVLIRAIFVSCVCGAATLDLSLSTPTLSTGFISGNNITSLYRLSGKKDFDFYPFLAYQSLWREYYRNGFVDEDDSNSISGAYLPADMDYKDILPYIEVIKSSSGLVNADSSNPLNFVLSTALGNFNLFTDSWFPGSVNSGFNGIWAVLFGAVSPAGSNIALNLRIIKNLVGSFDVNYINDYFTSGSISAQAQANVKLPIGGPFSVLSDVVSIGSFDFNLGVKNPDVVVARGATLSSSTDAVLRGTANLMNDPNLGTIPMLRMANIMQEIEEKSIMASGGRPYDFYKLFLGHIVSDARLHRPTFLGRQKSVVNITEVTQTGMSSQGQPLGDVAGKGYSVDSSRLFEVTADETCWIQVIMSIIPRPAYFQGVPIEMCKNDPFDSLVPDLQHIGMRSVDTSELYVGVDTDGTTDKADSVDVPFNFTDVYNEYRCSNDEIHGEFRNSMAYWTSVRTLKGIPRFNPDFIKVNSMDKDLYKPFAVANGYTSHVICQLYFDLNVVRPLDLFPSYSL